LPDQLLLCLLLSRYHLLSHLRRLAGLLLLLLLCRIHHYLSGVLLREVCQLRSRHHLSLGGRASAHHAHGLLVELGVPFNHKLFEGYEAVHRSDLVHDLLVQRIRARLLASLNELLLCHPQLCHQLTQQIIDHLLEALERVSE